MGGSVLPAGRLQRGGGHRRRGARVSDEQTARLAAPFVAVAPTAIWIAVSADGYFAGVAAWGLALLALAASRTVRWPILVAAGAGLLLGWAIFLNYGLMLIALPAVAVLIAARGPALGLARVGCRGARRARRGRRVRAGRVLVVRRLHACPATLLAGHRHEPAVPVLVVGELWRRWRARSDWAASRVSARVRRRGDQAAFRSAPGGAGRVLAIVFADLSMLSKAETERIWLPFTVWLTAAAGVPAARRSHRWWLAPTSSAHSLINLHPDELVADKTDFRSSPAGPAVAEQRFSLSLPL